MDVKISLPLLPLRDIVVFPSMVIPLFVGRDKSISALNEVMKKDKKIILVTQKNSEIDDPNSKDLFQYGCLSKVLQLLKLPDGTVKVLVEGEKRVKILKHKTANWRIKVWWFLTWDNRLAVANPAHFSITNPERALQTLYIQRCKRQSCSF